MDRYGTMLFMGLLLGGQILLKGYVRKSMANRLPSQKAAMEAVTKAATTSSLDLNVPSKKSD